jgi:Tol biopolymer transport system component
VNVTNVKLGELTQVDVASPAISANGSELWLGLNLPEGVGGTDIWLSREAGSGFSTPELVAELSSPFDDAPRPPTPDGTLMALSSKRHGGKYYQIYLSRRASADAAWEEPSQALLASVNGADFQSADGFLADGGRALYFASNREGLQSDLYVAHRGSPTEPFAEPTPVPDLNSPSSEERMPWLSGDGRHLFFASNRSGAYALYRADR